MNTVKNIFECELQNAGICGAPDPSDETTPFILLYIPSIKLPSKFIFLPIDQ